MKILNVLSTIIIETLNDLLEEWRSESMPGALKLFWQQVMAQHLTETLFSSFSFHLSPVCVSLCSSYALQSLPCSHPPPSLFKLLSHFFYFLSSYWRNAKVFREARYERHYIPVCSAVSTWTGWKGGRRHVTLAVTDGNRTERNPPLPPFSPTPASPHLTGRF